MLKSAFSNFVRMLGCSWLSFLASWIPLYIFRGTYFGEDRAVLENILMTVAGIVFACLFLVVITVKNDAVKKQDKKEILVGAFGGAALYAILWIATKGIYVFSVCGRHFALLLSRSADGVTFLSAFVSAVVFCAFYAMAILLGALIAKKKQA